MYNASMNLQKKRLIALAKAVEKNARLTPEEINYLLNFEKKKEQSNLATWLKFSALPLSLALGFFSTVFPDNFSNFIKTLPAWTNIPNQWLPGIDYLWDLLGEPVRKSNILYHIPNLALYSVSFFGLKKIFDSLEKRTWLDKVYQAQKNLHNNLESGKINFSLAKGHSLLFVGSGDYIGTQFVLNHQAEDSITISKTKPNYSKFWNYYDVTTLFADLKKVMERCDGKTAGEYLFFPVIDNEIFLPGPKAYDVSPHNLDILCQDLRMVEKEMNWKPKRIIIIGDKFHKSFVQSEDNRKIIPKSQESITLLTIAKKHQPAIILDPSDVVIESIINLAKGRKIVFRATKEGIKEYKQRFYERLKDQGYKLSKKKKGVLTIGYDLFEDQTEQQTLSRSIDDYYPVVLSKAVFDALVRNGYKKEEFLYVPELVLQKLNHLAKQQ